MKELLELVRLRAMTATAALRFTRRLVFDPVTIDYYLNTEPPRELTDLAPFCLIMPGKGSRTDKRVRQINVLFCLYNESREDAVTDLDLLETAAGNLSHPGCWTPWVQDRFSDFFGNADSGAQPHPLYYYSILLDFAANETLKFTPWRS